MSMQESPTPLSPEEMREQLRAFAERNTSSQAARFVRYDQGIAHPEESKGPSENVAVPLDLSTPVVPSDWQCTACGAKLDGSRLKIHVSRFAFGGQELAMCPHCGGAAQNRYHASVKQVEEQQQELVKQKTGLRNAIFCGVGLVLFLLSPSTLTYLLCWIIAFWCGPLQEIHLKMKLGAVFIILWAGFLGSFVIDVQGMDHIGKLMVWLLITVVIVAAGWMIERVAAFGGGLFYKG